MNRPGAEPVPRPRPAVSLIAAVARNGAIGRDHALLWHESADQQHFRRVTMGCPVIMGRTTWGSLPERFRPLPGRRNIVLTRNAAWRAEGADPAASLDAALALTRGHGQGQGQTADAPKVFVIGGAQIFALALPLATELVLTEIDADLPGDTFFPPWDRTRFTRTSFETHLDSQGVAYSFATYSRNQEI
jgi:dihydrofolate reductase